MVSTGDNGLPEVTFGVLFSDDKCANLFEALVGTLRAAKRKKIVTYEGELLLQGVHDNVKVKLLQDWPHVGGSVKWAGSGWGNAIECS